MEVRNLRVTCQYEDGAYLCLIDILDTYTLIWDEDVIYVARNGDSAPVNIWIISQIETGQFDPEFLEPTTKRSIILRMLRNLMSGLLDQEAEVKEALPYLNLVVAIDPDSMVERLTRAQMNQRIGEKASALLDVQWLIEHFPESGPENMRGMLDEWMQSLRRP
jgi:regulator of sirC expression with transglutaminase-like and TPR domain